MEKSQKKNKNEPLKRPASKTPRFPGAGVVVRVQANAQFAKAYEAIAKHQKGVWVGQDLSGSFAVRACLAVLPVARSREFREGIWLKGMGMSWKSLTELPGRLQRVADTIKSLNTKFFGISETCVNPLFVGFCGLPTVLQSYAETLNRNTTRIRKAFSPHPLSRQLSELSNFTMMATGQFRDKEVEELLNAAAIAMGCENMHKFDAARLAQVRYRQNKHRRT